MPNIGKMVSSIDAVCIRVKFCEQVNNNFLTPFKSAEAIETKINTITPTTTIQRQTAEQSMYVTKFTERHTNWKVNL